jgi:hypothetical protein
MCYLVAFGVGLAAAMAMLSFAIALPTATVAGPRMQRGLTLLAGAASLVVGLMMARELGPELRLTAPPPARPAASLPALPPRS